MSAHDEVLRVDGLVVETATGRRKLALVRGVSLSVSVGRTLCLVGESGSGKTITALALMRLLAGGLHVRTGEAALEGRPIELDSRQGPPTGLAMIFQEPMTALNPAFTIGDQIVEALRIHRKMAKREARAEALRLLEEVGIVDAPTRLSAYPHQLSGGMRQRVVIAIALACGPKVLIADEPTTALDVTVQAQILRLFRELQTGHGLGMILVTHDMGVVSTAGDDVAVMYAGQVVEAGSVRQVLEEPKHPYTQALLACMPSMSAVDGPPEPPEALAEIAGIVPPPTDWGTGCTFAPRCPFVRPECHLKAPRRVGLGEGRSVACWLYQEQREQEDE